MQGNPLPITITIAGDFCPILRVEHELLSGQRDAAWFVEEAESVFRGNDFVIVNQECVFTLNGSQIIKTGPCIKAHPETIQLLAHLGVGLVTLANNHIRDFGDEGVRKTIEACATHKIETVGAGSTLYEARQVYIRTIHGKRLGVINVAENEFSYATVNRAGANPFDIIDLIQDLQEVRLNTDHLILIVHGGLEDTNYPSPGSVKLLRFLAEQGVTAVIRHHSHYVQGYEVWKGVPIFYSLGNFLYDGLNRSSNSGWFEGIALTLQIAPDNTCSFTVHPFEQCLGEPRVHLIVGEKKEEFMTRLDHYSQVLYNPTLLKQEWEALIKIRRQQYYGQMRLLNYFLYRLFRRFGLLDRVGLPLRKRLVYENLLRCEAHREALLDILEQNHC